MSQIDVRTVLTTVAYRPVDMDALLDPNRPAYVRFDPLVGYSPSDVVLRDGVDMTWSTYTYEPQGQRRMVNYPERPCRLNTYGDSYTQCQQVSDDETWQERLAAHLGEPIRNFGCGGYGVYQAYRRAVAMEETDVAAEYVILNIWDDDHVRNLDAARWIRSAWNKRDKPKDQVQSLHGLPWPHLRYDVNAGAFVERAGCCKNEEELRALTDPELFYETFKDDSIVHLFTLMLGGEAPVDELQAVAEALGVEVDLNAPDRRVEDAQRLQSVYGFKSTEYVIDQMSAWAAEKNKKLMILLSYGQKIIRQYIEGRGRYDKVLVDYLDNSGLLYVDVMKKIAADYERYSVSPVDYLTPQFIQPSAAAVFGHYNPSGNHWFAWSIKDDLVGWLDPKPPAYAD